MRGCDKHIRMRMIPRFWSEHLEDRDFIYWGKEDCDSLGKRGNRDVLVNDRSVVLIC